MTSPRTGIELCAPARVTEIADAAQANLAAAGAGMPSASPTAKAPLKVSPAAVVSTAVTGNASIPPRKSRAARKQPMCPSFRTTTEGPISSKRSAARAASSKLSIARSGFPSSRPASDWLRSQVGDRAQHLPREGTCRSGVEHRDSAAPQRIRENCLDRCQRDLKL